MNSMKTHWRRNKSSHGAFAGQNILEIEDENEKENCIFVNINHKSQVERFSVQRFTKYLCGHGKYKVGE